MVKKRDTRPIEDARDIRTIPHDIEYVGYSRKPQSFYEQLSSYIIIRLVEPNMWISDKDNSIRMVAHEGDYLVQSTLVYDRPEIFKTYADLQKRYYIPRGAKHEVTPNYEYYGTQYAEIVQKYIDMWDAEVERSSAPRKRFINPKVAKNDVSKILDET